MKRSPLIFWRAFPAHNAGDSNRNGPGGQVQIPAPWSLFSGRADEPAQGLRRAPFACKHQRRLTPCSPGVFAVLLAVFLLFGSTG